MKLALDGSATDVAKHDVDAPETSRRRPGGYCVPARRILPQRPQDWMPDLPVRPGHHRASPDRSSQTPEDRPSLHGDGPLSVGIRFSRGIQSIADVLVCRADGPERHQSLPSSSCRGRGQGWMACRTCHSGECVYSVPSDDLTAGLSAADLSAACLQLGCVDCESLAHTNQSLPSGACDRNADHRGIVRLISHLIRGMVASRESPGPGAGDRGLGSLPRCG